MVDNEEILTEEKNTKVEPESEGSERQSPSEKQGVGSDGASEETVSEVIDEVKSVQDGVEMKHQPSAPHGISPGRNFSTTSASGSAGLGPEAVSGGLDLLMDVNVTLRVELGRTRKTIEEILKLSPGMLVELDRASGEDVDIFVNDKLLASGEVTVVDGYFAIKITRILSKAERLRNML